MMLRAPNMITNIQSTSLGRKYSARSATSQQHTPGIFDRDPRKRNVFESYNATSQKIVRNQVPQRHELNLRNFWKLTTGKPKPPIECSGRITFKATSPFLLQHILPLTLNPKLSQVAWARHSHTVQGCRRSRCHGAVLASAKLFPEQGNHKPQRTRSTCTLNLVDLSSGSLIFRGLAECVDDGKQGCEKFQRRMHHAVKTSLRDHAKV